MLMNNDTADNSEDAVNDACCNVDSSITAGTNTVTGKPVQVLDANLISLEEPSPLFLVLVLFDLPPPQVMPLFTFQSDTNYTHGSHTYLQTLRLRI